MEELANELVVEARLPFLDQRQFDTAIISTFSIDWDGSPNIQIVVLLPVAKGQFGLD